MDKVCWGIIGAGDVTEKKSGPAFYKIEHSELVAVMRRDAMKVKDYAQRHHVENWYTDADALIHDPHVNAIYVATPPGSHKEYTLRALKAGKPVYVEKPMAMNYAECREMTEAAEKYQQKLFVAYYRRALPYFLKVKELLDQQAIGELLTVDVAYMAPPFDSDRDPATHTWRIDPALGGDGYFYDMAPHTLDILDFFFGEITEAKGFGVNLGGLYAVSDTVTATLRFASGVLGSGRWCFVGSESSVCDKIVIAGTKGEIHLATFSFAPIRLITDDGEETFVYERPEHIQQPLIQTIVDELRSVGVCPSTGISGARTSRVMDCILK